MTEFADMHTHTYLCNHADGEPAEYLAAARKQNLAFLGVSDHFPAPDGYDAMYRMMPLQYDIYRNIVQELKRSAAGFGDIEVLYGTEFDYVPGRMKEVCDAVSREDFDYTIGSIHYIDSFAFDDPAKKAEWLTRGVDELWDRYFELLGEFVNGFEFDIIGHCDLPKKFSYRHSSGSYTLKRMRAVFEIASRKGMCLELNTSGLRREAREIYPSLPLLRQAFEAGMNITFGSDSHTPSDVGRDFSLARELALAAGYRTVYAIRRHGLVEFVL